MSDTPGGYDADQAMIDVVGHIPVIVILAATLLQGETPLQRTVRGPVTSVSGSVMSVLVRYIIVLATLMALYYGLHAVSVWAGGKSAPEQVSH